MPYSSVQYELRQLAIDDRQVWRRRAVCDIEYCTPAQYPRPSPNPKGRLGNFRKPPPRDAPEHAAVGLGVGG